MRILTALLLAFFVSSAHAADYFLLCSGQSNMAGVAKVADLPENMKLVPDNVVYFKDFDPAQPLQPVKSFAESPKFGPMPSFLHALSKARPKDRFIVLHDAVGGSALASWVPDYGPPELTSRPGKNGTTVKLDIGKNYRAMAGRIAVLEKEYPEAKPLAFLWIQGESDAGKWADAYLENFKRLVANVRRDTDAPKLFVVVAEPGKTVDAVRKAFKDYVKLDPQSTLVQGLDLSHGQLHYDAKGYLELGRRLARQVEASLAN